MTFDDLLILIPSHSLEDFPAEQGESEAASLLNSFAVPWHPALLAAAKVLPRWHRADDPPDSTQRRLILVPSCAESWLPAGWAERLETEGCTVIRNLSDRTEMLQAALAPLDPGSAVDPELAADFLALGTCHLLLELLTRKMRHFSNLDEVHLQREVVGAAEAAVAGDAETARTRLQSCFDLLAESRERFYPVDCFLIDLCLLIPRLADDHLQRAVGQSKPISILVSAADLEEIAEKSTAAHAALCEACRQGVADLICGDLSELPLPLMPLTSTLWQFDEAHRLVQKHLQRRPAVWGRRRFGVSPQLPQILKKHGFQGALHVVLDDGFYPDAEHSKLRWEGTDGSVLDAWSRIPLAGDGAASFLRFPDRMSESMDNDQVAAVAFARWPEVKTPWLDDLRRMHRYAPVLGKFTTFSDFFENTEASNRMTAYKPREYLTPYLFQSVAREEADPITRYSGHIVRRDKFDAGAWLVALRNVLTGRTPRSPEVASLEASLERVGEHPVQEKLAEIEPKLDAFVSDAGKQLADLINRGAGDRPGYFVFNTLSFRRIVSVPLPSDAAPPQPDGEKCRVQWDDRHRTMTVDVPGAGFVWIPAASAPPPIPDRHSGPPLAEQNLLRNEQFEVHINPQTGGIQQIKGYGRSPNRLSQQLNYRYSRERTVTIGEGDRTEQIKSQYAEMRCRSSQVTSVGPALGEIVTAGDIVDQKDNRRLAGYTQTVRVWRGRPVVEIDIELVIDRMPDAEPWHNYFTSRFAWNDETASLSYSSLMGVYEAAAERIESPYFLELATPEERTTILTLGQPFHRKTGPRMIDSILVVPRESRRRFRFVVAIDQPYPMQAALDALTAPVVVPTRTGPPRSGNLGWFFHLNTRAVQLLQILPLRAGPDNSAANSSTPASPDPNGSGFVLRLLETEGRTVRTRLRCFRAPKRARQINFLGETIGELPLDGDAVLVDLTGYEIADVEIRFD
jgi:alpha-mannosidase